MINWTRTDQVVATVRLVRRPISIADIADLLGEDIYKISSTVSYLYQIDELNRTREPDERGRLRYLYTDPAYDELIAARELIRKARFAASLDCEEPNYTLSTAIDEYERAIGLS